MYIVAAWYSNDMHFSNLAISNFLDDFWKSNTCIPVCACSKCICLCNFPRWFMLSVCLCCYTVLMLFHGQVPLEKEILIVVRVLATLNKRQYEEDKGFYERWKFKELLLNIYNLIHVVYKAKYGMKLMLNILGNTLIHFNTFNTTLMSVC